MPVSSVLFVCTANQCRSPMAQELLKAQLKKKLGAIAFKTWRIESAGTWTQGGQPAVPGVQAVLASHGLSLADHRSQAVSAELLAQFNLVLVMEQGHKEALRVEFPQFAKRVYLLSEIVYSNFEVRDPLGGKPADYEAAAEVIDEALRDGLERIIKLAAGSNEVKSDPI
jgi:protein-tyrosine-phosphatase